MMNWSSSSHCLLNSVRFSLWPGQCLLYLVPISCGGHILKRCLLSCLLLLLSCLLPAGTLAAAEKLVPDDLPELIRPGAEHLDDTSMQAAMQASVKAGVLFLIEEMLDPGRDTVLVYPAHAAIKKIGEKQVERRYRKDKKPIYEKKKVKRLVPKRDEYGGIIGYEEKWVEVRASDKIVGYRDVMVPDKDGDVVRQITVPILDRSNKMLPRGWWGMNAQGLLLLCRCGIGQSTQVHSMADELERYMNMFGMPDTTWDLSWMAVAWMALSEADPDRSERRDRLIGKLIDGAILAVDRKNPARGLWGPISIHDHAQEKLFRVELELQTLFQETEAAMEQANGNKLKKLQDEFKKISAALAEVKRANRNIAQQGRRLSEVERPWKMNENVKTTGISYYMYNRDIFDIDSTAVAAMALAEAQRRSLLPEATPRDTIRGRTLVKPLVTEDIIETAYDSIFDKAPETGCFDSRCMVFPVDAYDKVPNLAGVPLAVPLPALLRPESWYSNTSGLAALLRLDSLVDERQRSRNRDRDEMLNASRQRVLAIIKTWLDSEPLHDEWQGPHAGETDSLKTLAANNGWPVPAEKDEDDIIPVEKLSVGHLRTPRACLEHLLVLYQQDQPEIAKARQQLAYRLLIEQQSDGSWPAQSPRSSGAPGLSSGEWSYLLGKIAQRHLWQARDDQKKKPDDPLTEDFKRDGPWPYRWRKKMRSWKHICNIVFKGEGNEPHQHGYAGSDYYTVDMRIAESLAALLYLSEGLKEQPQITQKEVLAVLTRSQEAKTAYEQALSELQEAEMEEDKRDEAIKKLEKEGPEMQRSEKGQRGMLHEVWRQILLAAGLDKKLFILEPDETEDAKNNAGDTAGEKTGGDNDKNTDFGDQENEDEASPGDTLDDILGGDD